MSTLAEEHRHGERIAALEENRAHLATREDLSVLESRIYKVLLIQTGVILAGVGTLFKLLV